MIVAIDLSDRKLQLARELGATHCFNAGDADIVAKIREVTQGGLEYTFEIAQRHSRHGTCLANHAPRQHHRNCRDYRTRTPS